jgi:Flp pilus assembly pilin Flp
MCSYRTTTAEDEAWIETVDRKLNTLDRDKTMTKFSAFLKDEAGAVTVDWVVLTAAIVGLGLLVFTFVRPAVSNLAQGIATELGAAQACMEANGASASCN